MTKIPSRMNIDLTDFLVPRFFDLFKVSSHFSDIKIIKNVFGTEKLSISTSMSFGKKYFEHVRDFDESNQRRNEMFCSFPNYQSFDRDIEMFIATVLLAFAIVNRLIEFLIAARIESTA